MAVVYPGGVDSFNEPSLPEFTSLSSAGTGSRAHVEHHHDLGQAVIALESNAAKKAHDHSGDAADTSKGAKLTQANTHQSADTDTSTTAIHHTLGTGANQAAAGNHTHTAANYVLCTSSTRPSSPYLGLMIYETDTNRVRSWATIAPAVTPSWRLMPVASVPICHLRQGAFGTTQGDGSKLLSIPQGGNMEWRDEVEDNFGMFNSGASVHDIVVRETGLYHIIASILWGGEPNFTVQALVHNGVRKMDVSGYPKLQLYTNLEVSQGYVRCTVDDVLRVGLWGYSDPDHSPHIYYGDTAEGLGPLGNIKQSSFHAVYVGP
jgi:hypothetical protein